MKLVTFQRDGLTQPGVLENGNVVGVKGAGFATLLEIIQGGPAALDRVKEWANMWSESQVFPN